MRMRDAGRLTRRALVAGSAAAAAAAACGPALKAAQPKVTKAAAKYQDHPNGQQRCAICLNFEPPDQCRLVQGPIAKEGWCQFFAAKENAH